MRRGHGRVMTGRLKDLLVEAQTEPLRALSMTVLGADHESDFLDLIAPRPLGWLRTKAIRWLGALLRRTRRPFLHVHDTDLSRVFRELIEAARVLLAPLLELLKMTTKLLEMLMEPLAQIVADLHLTQSRQCLRHTVEISSAERVLPVRSAALELLTELGQALLELPTGKALERSPAFLRAVARSRGWLVL